MTNTITVQNNPVYGAFELKKLYPRNFSIGLIIAVIFHILLISAYYFYQSITKEDTENIPTVRILKYSELGPPPSITNDVPQQVSVSAPVAAPTVGVPVPVPDEEAPPEQTIATQQEMSQQASPALTEGLGSGTTQITQDIKIEPEKTEEDPDINAYVPVEKLPEMVVTAQPEYPEIARRAGITGKVYVKVLVDKQGKPKKAVILKSDAEVFNEAAIAAAMKCVFTPAIQNNHPVSVWIVLPYKFTLQGQ